MSLPYEYFKNKEHITDLKKLKDDEVYFLIKSLYEELDKLNDKKTTQLKDLNKLCDKAIDIFKDIRFILNGYITVLQENYYNDEEKEAIEGILYELDKIENNLNILKSLKINGMRVNKLVSDLLIFVRLLYLTLSDLLFIKNN